MTTYQYVTPTGVIVPNTDDLKTTVDSEWQGNFGAGLNTDSSTPQGVVIASDVTARTEVVNNNAAVANQINPNQAEGVFLDAICALTGLERSADTFSTVTLALAGVPGSPISSGVTATSPLGDAYALNTDVVLDPITGAATGLFTATVAGPVPAPTGTYAPSNVLGWETATAAVTGSVGTAQQSDEALRVLRAQTLFLQGVSLIGATLSAVNALTGVLSSQGLENVTSSTATISGVSLVAHSIWVCVDGGIQADIANALLHNKSQGAGWNGAVVTNVAEPSSGQIYVTKYDVPTLVPLLVRVTCRQGAFTGNPASDIPNAVVTFANNQVPGLQGFTLGQNASPFEVSMAINIQCPGLYVSKVELSLVSSVDYQPAEIAMAIFQKATVIGADVSVVIS